MDGVKKRNRPKISIKTINSERFWHFFRHHQHQIIPRASIIPIDIPLAIAD